MAKTAKSGKSAKSPGVPDTTRQFYDEIHKLVSDKGFDRAEVMSIIEAGLIAAYRKKYKTTENARVIFDKEKENVYVIARRMVVDNVVLPGMQIHIDEARKINPNVKLGDELDIIERPMDYGRISAQTAMQVVSQRLKALEQNKIRQEYSTKIGELMNGYILRKKNDTIYVDLGKVEAIMPIRHQIPGEKYRVEDKIKVLLLNIESDTQPGGLKVIVSRADRKFVQKLFEMEVPEIYDNIVEIKAIGRAPGIRTKVVVASNRSDVDPVGACVGVKGVRIQAIVRELGNERIDIVEYSTDPAEFIANAMTPATPVEVKVDPVAKEALVLVADHDQAIAIGKEGTNVKLASQVTGYRIDVKSQSQFREEMSSPEARKRLDELFATPAAVEAEEEEGTPLEELPGLTPRVIRILRDSGVRFIEDLVSLDEEGLIGLEGIGRATAKQIMSIIAENVEFEEVAEEEDVNEAQEVDTTAEEK